MQPLNFVFSKTDYLIFFKDFVRTLQAHFYQPSEFKVGTVMGLGDIFSRMTASKQKHVGMTLFRYYNNASTSKYSTNEVFVMQLTFPFV